jgi:hypothetical protein
MRNQARFFLWKRWRVIPAATLFIFVISCERRTEIKLADGIPPTFVLSGSGRLGELVIFGPEQEKVAAPFDKTYSLWEIAPETEGEKGASLVEDLHTITYGVVPQGYKQTKPENGAPPPPLTSGRRYRYLFVTVNSPHAAGYFEVQNGKAVSVSGP